MLAQLGFATSVTPETFVRPPRNVAVAVDASGSTSGRLDEVDESVAAGVERRARVGRSGAGQEPASGAASSGHELATSSRSLRQADRGQRSDTPLSASVTASRSPC